jgi:ribosome-binding factor A
VADRATIFFTVLPEEKEEGALGLAKRKRAEFRDFFAGKARVRALPFLTLQSTRVRRTDNR